MELTIIFRKAHAQMSFLDLLNKHIFLVEEKYNRGGGKVAVVANAVEQVQTLVHSILKDTHVLSRGDVIQGNVTVWLLLTSYHFVILHQHHVVGAQSSDEDDTGHTFETVDPLLPLGPLSTHVKHSEERDGVVFHSHKC